MQLIWHRSFTGGRFAYARSNENELVKLSDTVFCGVIAEACRDADRLPLDRTQTLFESVDDAIEILGLRPEDTQWPRQPPRSLH